MAQFCERWPAMGAAQRRPRPPCGRANAPRLEIERRNCGRAFPVGWGLAVMGGLRPTAWYGSAAMGGDARGVTLETAALWTGQLPSIGGWVMEMRQGVSQGGGGGWDGRVAPSNMARFCGDGRRCARCSVSQDRLVDGKTLFDWRLGDGNAAGHFPGVGGGGDGRLCPAAWRDSAAMRAAQRRKWLPCGRDSALRLEIGPQKTGRSLPGEWGTAHHF